MKKDKYYKAFTLMSQDYNAISEHSNQFIMMTRKQETDWENAQIAQYMQLPEKFLDFEIQRRANLTNEQKDMEEMSLVFFRSRKDAKELVAEYKNWNKTQVTL